MSDTLSHTRLQLTTPTVPPDPNASLQA